MRSTSTYERTRMADIAKLFGKKVRQLRTSKGISQEELAFRAGIHRTYLGGIERGERNPCLVNIARIAKALKVSMPELFDYDTAPANHPSMSKKQASI